MEAFDVGGVYRSKFRSQTLVEGNDEDFDCIMH